MYGYQENDAELDFDREDDMARLEHYQLHGNRPRLMPDLGKIRVGRRVSVPMSHFGTVFNPGRDF